MHCTENKTNCTNNMGAFRIAMGIDSLIVSDFMSRDVKTGKEFQTIKEICKTMNDNDIGSVIYSLTKDNKPIAMVTERDIVNEIGSSEFVCCGCTHFKNYGQGLDRNRGRE